MERTNPRELGEAKLIGLGDCLDEELTEKGEISRISIFLAFGN